MPKPRLGKEGQKIQKYFLEKDIKVKLDLTSLGLSTVVIYHNDSTQDLACSEHHHTS